MQHLQMKSSYSAPMDLNDNKYMNSMNKGLETTGLPVNEQESREMAVRLQHNR